MLIFSASGMCEEPLVIESNCDRTPTQEWHIDTAIYQGDVDYVKKTIHRHSPKAVVTRLLNRFEVYSKLSREQLLIGKYLVEMGADPNARLSSCTKGQPSSPVVSGYRFLDTDNNLQFALYLLEKGLQPTAELAINTIRSTAPSDYNQDGYPQILERARLLLDAYVKHGLLKQGKVDFANVAAPFRYVSDPRRDAYRSFIGELLSKDILNPDSPLFGANRPYEAKLFLEHGGNPAAVNDKGETPLHFAVRQRDPVPLVWAMLAHGNRGKFTAKQLESAAALSNDYLVKKMIHGIETKSATLLVKDVPHFSKEEIRAPDFYKHAMGVIEQDGVKAYYGLATDPAEPEYNFVYMIFENHSGQWIKPGFTLLAGPPDGDPQSGFTRFLFSPIPSSDARHPLSSGLLKIDGGWTYQLSLETERPQPLLQKYMQQRSGDQAMPGIYKPEPFKDEMESKATLKFLGLKNDIGFELDDITKRACGDHPQSSLTRYRYRNDDVYMFHSNCTDWGGDGTFGKNFLALFRLDKEGNAIWLLRSDRQKGLYGFLEPYIGRYGSGGTVTDLDLDGNVELPVLQNGGLSSSADMFEIVDGGLKSFYHIDSWSEGEPCSESESAIGLPFQDCVPW